MEIINFPDETLPGFNYLDQLSEVTTDDLIVAIANWKERYKGDELKNILEAEVSDG
jgi:hypothetical protein